MCSWPVATEYDRKCEGDKAYEGVNSDEGDLAGISGNQSRRNGAICLVMMPGKPICRCNANTIIMKMDLTLNSHTVLALTV